MEEESSTKVTGGAKKRTKRGKGKRKGSKSVEESGTLLFISFMKHGN